MSTTTYWAIKVSGYGEFFMRGTNKEAEAMRIHKANWERAIAHLRPATRAEYLAYAKRRRGL